MRRAQRRAVFLTLLPAAMLAASFWSCAAQTAIPAPAPPPPPPPLQKPVVAYFTIAPQTILAGQNATVLWEIEGAASVTLDPPGGEIPAQGSQVVNPVSSTSYTLIASNGAGTVTRTQYLNVNTEHTALVGVDPVTGRNEGIGFRWEQLCLATGYQVQIAKDPGFTLIVFDSGVYSPSVSTSPAMLYAPGGVLEAGHSYYWRARVRQTATGDAVHSPWSAPQRFTISQGVPVSTPYPGVMLLKPANNCAGCAVQDVAFAWTPFKDTTEYLFKLAEDAGLSEIVVAGETAGTSFTCAEELKYDTVYFWQVTPTAPVPGEPSAVFSFTTGPRPLPQPAATGSPATVHSMPGYVQLIIVIGILLIATVLVFMYLAYRKRRGEKSSSNL